MVSAVVFDHLGQSDENSVFAWIKRGGGEGLLDPTLPLNEWSQIERNPSFPQPSSLLSDCTINAMMSA